MSSNATPDNPDVCVSLMEDILDGLDSHEVSIGIKQNTKVTLQSVLAAYNNAENAFANAKAMRATKATEVKDKDDEVKAWLLNAAKVLRISLGEKWSAQWEPTHFPDSKTQVPSTQAKRFTLIGKLAIYFAAHAAQEAANQGVTAAAATALHAQISNCRDALHQAETDQKNAKKARDTAEAAMRTRIRSFVVELGTLLGPDDPRWDAFGLSRPSDPDTPLSATNFTATQAGPGNLLYKWKRAKRATYYRLFYKILGVDADFHQHEPNPQGLSLTLEALPSGATVEAYLIAANEAGEAEATATISAVVA